MLAELKTTHICTVHKYYMCISMLMQVQDLKIIFEASNDIVLNLKFKTML